MIKMVDLKPLPYKELKKMQKQQESKKNSKPKVKKKQKSKSSSKSRSFNKWKGPMQPVNTGSSSSKSSKTVSGNDKQGGTGKKQGSSDGLTPPPGYSGPIPPQAPSIYDKDQPLAGKKPKTDTGMPKDTQKAVEQAPYSPIKEKTSKPKPKTMSKSEYVQKTYTTQQQIDRQLSNVQKQQEQIDPNQRYLIEKKVNGKTEQIEVSGSYLLKEFYNPAEKQITDASLQSQKSFQQAQQLPPGTKITETKKGYKFKFTNLTPEQYQTKKELKQFYQKTDPATKIAHIWSAGMLSYENPLGLKTLYYSVTGQPDKALDTQAKAVTDLDKSLNKGIPSYAVKAYTGPLASVGIAYGVGAAAGAGFGAAKAAFPVAGKVAEAGFGVTMAGVAAKETIPQVQKAIKTGDYGNIAGTIGLLGVTGYSGYKGYRTGHAFGYGRTRAYLYRKHTFKPGTAQDVQFKEALKVARKLENVKSHKQKPLDIAKDIARMDEKTAARTLDYLKRHPRTTIGGSASSYTQIEGARTPQDIDLLLSGGKRSVARAKKFFGKTKTSTGEHLIDIHGKSFYKPGRHHEFGFRSKSPIRIGGKRMFRAGEQLFRKGVASVKIETKYRWFKDRPDFLTHAKSLITSGKRSKNPLNRFRARTAEQSLQRYLNPQKAYSYGKTESRFGQFVRKYTRKSIEPTSVYNKGSLYYQYPKSTYPSYTAGLIGGRVVPYPKYSSIKQQNFIYPTRSKSPKQAYPKNIQKLEPKYSKIKQKKPYPIIQQKTSGPSYSTPVKTPKINAYTPTKKTMPYPQVKTPKYKTTRYKAKNIIPISTTTTKKYWKNLEMKPKKGKKIMDFKMPEYRFREFDIPTLKKLLGGSM